MRLPPYLFFGMFVFISIAGCSPHQVVPITSTPTKIPFTATYTTTPTITPEPPTITPTPTPTQQSFSIEQLAGLKDYEKLNLAKEISPETMLDSEWEIISAGFPANWSINARNLKWQKRAIVENGQMVEYVALLSINGMERTVVTRYNLLTGKFVPYKIKDFVYCTKWRDAWDGKCPVLFENLIDGDLIHFAQKVGEPFGPESYNSGVFYLYKMNNPNSPVDTWISWPPQRSLATLKLISKDTYNYKHYPEKRPYRYILFFSTKIDGFDYIVAIQQWKNPDNSISYLQYLTTKRNLDFNRIVYGVMWQGFPKVDCESEKFYDGIFGKIARDTERMIYLNRWKVSGKIPDELQFKINIPIYFLESKVPD